jgi:hypothetical protein
MFDSNLLDRRSHFHLFFDRMLVPKRSVEACPAHSRQLTHALDTQRFLDVQQPSAGTSVSIASASLCSPFPAKCAHPGCLISRVQSIAKGITVRLVICPWLAASRAPAFRKKSPSRAVATESKCISHRIQRFLTITGQMRGEAELCLLMVSDSLYHSSVTICSGLYLFIGIPAVILSKFSLTPAGTKNQVTSTVTGGR